MGQVFTWEAVQSGHIPALPAFPFIIESVKRELALESSIVGALVCGSVVRGDHNVRSDLDCFVLYDHRQEYRAFEVLQSCTQFAAARYVPLTFIPCDTRVAQTWMHHLGNSFLAQLHTSADAGGILKGNPLRCLASGQSVQEETEGYLRVKMYNLQEAWGQWLVFSPEQRMSYLKKLLEAPLHIARKTLAHQEPLAEDSKSYIRSLYRERMPTVMADQLDAFATLDATYTNKLNEQMVTPNQKEYEAFLRHISCQSEDVLSFAYAQTWHSLPRGSASRALFISIKIPTSSQTASS